VRHFIQVLRLLEKHSLPDLTVAIERALGTRPVIDGLA